MFVCLFFFLFLVPMQHGCSMDTTATQFTPSWLCRETGGEAKSKREKKKKDKDWPHFFFLFSHNHTISSSSVLWPVVLVEAKSCCGM